MWRSIIPWKQTTSVARHIINCNAVAFPNQVVGGRESLLNKGNFLSVHGCSFSRRYIEWQRALRTSEAFFAFLVVVGFSICQWFLSWSHSNFCLASVGHWNWTSWYMISQYDLQTFSLGDLIFFIATAQHCVTSSSQVLFSPAQSLIWVLLNHSWLPGFFRVTHKGMRIRHSSLPQICWKGLGWTWTQVQT